MAATLLEIKSQMLMPALEEGESPAGEGQAASSPVDPRHELVQQLLAYKRNKDAARLLEERQAQWLGRFPAQAAARERSQDAELLEIDLEDLNVFDLAETFVRLMDSIGQVAQHEVTYDDTPISLHAEDIHDRLQREGALTLAQIFEGRPHRSERIGLFLATLELVRQRRVAIWQDQATGQIKLELRPAEPQQEPDDADAPADWRDPQTGQVEYDWPDDESRQRAQRRAELRAKRSSTGQFGQDADADEPSEPDDPDEPDDDDASLQEDESEEDE
ncbi:MAG TPA: segregation/condensation protein A, partial [Phycisphaeraceae bacterium]